MATSKRGLFLIGLLTFATQLATGQNCGTPSTHNTPSGGVTGTGSSTLYATLFDRRNATNIAEEAIEGKLGIASGVVCAICTATGLQCARSVEMTSGTATITYTEIPANPPEHDGGWEVSYTWEGKYDVNCAACN